MKRLLFAIAAFVLPSVISCNSHGSESGEQGSIDNGLNATTEKDSPLVFDGTYSANVTLMWGRHIPDVLKEALDEVKAGRLREVDYTFEDDSTNTSPIFITPTGRCFIVDQVSADNDSVFHRRYLSVAASKIMCRRCDIEYTDPYQEDSIETFASVPSGKNLVESTDSALWHWRYGWDIFSKDPEEEEWEIWVIHNRTYP